MKKTISIEGMTCHNCVRHVTEALTELDGVSDVKVDLEGKKANVVVNPQVTDIALKEVVTEAGYTPTAVTSAE